MAFEGKYGENILDFIDSLKCKINKLKNFIKNIHTVLIINDSVNFNITQLDFFNLYIKNLEGELIDIINSDNNTIYIDNSCPDTGDVEFVINGELIASIECGENFEFEVIDENENLTGFYNENLSKWQVNKWERNPQWQPIPSTADRAFIVWAVFENEIVNGCELELNPEFTVDWGDGNTDSTTASIKIHSYDYATISAPIIQSYDGRNYKPVLIEIDRNGGDPNVFRINDTNSNVFPNNALEIVDRLVVTNNRKNYRLSGGGFGALVSRTGQASYLERVELISRFNTTGTNAANSARNAFINASNCQVFIVPSDFITGVGSTVYADFFTNSFKNVDLSYLNITFVANSSTSFLQRCGITEVGNILIGSSTNQNNFFAANTVLRKVGNVISQQTSGSYAGLFSGCKNLIEIGDLDFSNGITTLNQMFEHCSSLGEIVFVGSLGSITTFNNNFRFTGNIRRCVLTGLRLGFDISGNRMQAAQLNEMFTSLGVAAGSQTIDVRNNPGAATCDTTIATSKGYAVIIS